MGAATSTDGLWAPERRALTIGLVMTITIFASESLSVVTIMPLVARDLGGLRLYGSVFSAFMLASMVGIVAAGRQADRRGPAQPYIAGLILFGSGLVLSGLAPSMLVLVLGRILQGLGSGAIPAVAYVAIGRSLPDRLRPRMMAVMSTAWVLPGLFGPGLGALVARQFSWRWVFLGLLPLVALAGPIALRSLFRLGRPEGSQSADEHRLVDVIRTAVGAGLMLAGLTVAHLLPLLALVVVGVVTGVPGLRRLLPPGTFTGRPGLPATVLSRALLTFSFFGADAFVTLAITTVRHRTASVASIVVTAGALTWTVGAWLQARVGTPSNGPKLVRAGLLIILVGIAGTASALQPTVPVAVAIVSWSLAGFGIGMAYAPLSLMMLREAQSGREGWASASLSLAEVLGTALGVGFGGVAVAFSASTGRSLASGIRVAFSIAAAGALTALIAARHLPVVVEPAPGVSTFPAVHTSGSL